MWYEALSGPLRRQRAVLLVASAAAGILIVAGTIAAALRFGAGIAVPLGTAALVVLGLLVALLLLLGRLSAKLNDTRALSLLLANTTSRGWTLRDFYLDGAAADASLCLLLFKCLSLGPRRVLELGSGQTTKLLWNYCREQPEAAVVSLEQSDQWTAILSGYLQPPAPNHRLLHAPLDPVSVPSPGGGAIDTRWYHANLEGQFDLILVDGPNGTPTYSRAGIVGHLPRILAPTFVIIMDDAERYGEVMTVDLIERTLRAAGIRYVRWEVNGLKRQVAIASPDRAFLAFS